MPNYLLWGVPGASSQGRLREGGEAAAGLREKDRIWPRVKKTDHIQLRQAQEAETWICGMFLGHLPGCTECVHSPLPMPAERLCFCVRPHPDPSHTLQCSDQMSPPL